MRFNRYNSWNFKVHFCNWTCRWECNIHEYKIKIAQLFVTSSNVSLMNFMSDGHSIFKQCSKWPPAAATHNRSLLQNDTIALLMNLCGKSFHIINKAVLLAYICNSIPALCSIHGNPLDLYGKFGGYSSFPIASSLKNMYI